MSHDVDRKQEHREFWQEASSLFRITLAPVVWAMHFVVSYASTAIFCAKFGEGAGSIVAFRLGFGTLTLLALGVIAWIGWKAWRQWDRIADGDIDNDKATDEDRHQFLGNAAFLLAIISFVGVVYTALPVAFIGTCR